METKSLSIRAARQEDAGKLAHLLSLFEGDQVTPAQVLARMEATAQIETPLLAEAEGHLIGLACLRMAPSLSSAYPQAELIEFYIEKTFQGNGIERALLERAESLAVDQGAPSLVLLTGLKNNETQALLRALGYRDYALAMRKILKG
jgi:GNAT superfamily N-acetyltransferase